MARIRTIKPDFWVDEKVVECSAFARLCFIGLWNFADDDGRMEYRPKKIKMQIFPADNLDISELIGELRGEKLVTVYVVDDKEYLQIRGFYKHQKIDKRYASRHPAPPNPASSPRITPDHPDGMEGKGREGKRKGDKEQGDKSPLSAVKPPTCPHSEIVNAFHDALPELPRILLPRWSGSQSEINLRARWKENPEHQLVEWWERFFQVVRTNPHWMGDNDRAWTADLHWLVKRTNFDKVMQLWANMADAA